MANRAHLRILETTDLHANLLAYDYFTDTPDDSLGLARTASLIKAARQEAGTTLTFDNGDFLQGTPLADYMAFEHAFSDDDVHPVVAAMNSVGYDAGTLGNHEFNYGLTFLQRALQGASFPFVSSNLKLITNPKLQSAPPFYKPYDILQRTVVDGEGTARQLKIGVIGFLPPQTMKWDHHNLDGHAIIDDILETARHCIPEMKRLGADIIIALCHSGIGAAAPSPQMENASIPLAEIDGVDVILTGHSHLTFPGSSHPPQSCVDPILGQLHGKPAVMAGSLGSYLGVIDLLLERQSGRWAITDQEVALRPISYRDDHLQIIPTTTDDADLVDRVAPYHKHTLNYVRRPVGRTKTAIHSYFALIANEASLQVVAEAQRWHVANRLQHTPYAGLPLLSAASPFKAGGRGGAENYTNIPAGDLAIKNISDLYLFPNILRVVRITGQTLLNWLEKSASVFNQIPVGTHGSILLNPKFASYDFDVINGISYQIDVSQPARFSEVGTVQNPRATRVINATFQGQGIRKDMEFVVATNSYRVSGGGNFAGTAEMPAVIDNTETSRDIIMRYVQDQKTLDHKVQPIWGFAPLPNTSALFETGVGALCHLDDDLAATLTPLETLPSGFVRFRVDF